MLLKSKIFTFAWGRFISSTLGGGLLERGGLIDRGDLIEGAGLNKFNRILSVCLNFFNLSIFSTHEKNENFQF